MPSIALAAEGCTAPASQAHLHDSKPKGLPAVDFFALVPDRGRNHLKNRHFMDRIDRMDVMDNKHCTKKAPDNLSMFDCVKRAFTVNICQKTLFFVKGLLFFRKTA